MSVMCTLKLLSLFEAQKLQDRLFFQKFWPTPVGQSLRISKASQADNMLYNSKPIGVLWTQQYY